MSILRCLFAILVLSTFVSCHQDNASVTIPISAGFQPLIITTFEGEESLTLIFLSTNRALFLFNKMTPDKIPGDDINDHKKFVSVTPEIYDHTKESALAIMASAGIQSDYCRGRGTSSMTISIGANSGSIMFNITRSQNHLLPASCREMEVFIESFRTAPDIGPAREESGKN